MQLKIFVHTYKINIFILKSWENRIKKCSYLRQITVQGIYARRDNVFHKKDFLFKVPIINNLFYRIGRIVKKI